MWWEPTGSYRHVIGTHWLTPTCDGCAPTHPDMWWVRTDLSQHVMGTHRPDNMWRVCTDSFRHVMGKHRLIPTCDGYAPTYPDMWWVHTDSSRHVMGTHRLIKTSDGYAPTHPDMWGVHTYLLTLTCDGCLSTHSDMWSVRTYSSRHVIGANRPIQTRDRWAPTHPLQRCDRCAHINANLRSLRTDSCRVIGKQPETYLHTIPPQQRYTTSLHLGRRARRASEEHNRKWKCGRLHTGRVRWGKSQQQRNCRGFVYPTYTGETYTVETLNNAQVSSIEKNIKLYLM